MDLVDQIESTAADISYGGSAVEFEPIMGKMFRIPYEELRPIMRSAFQKHIRRGHDYAHRWGHYLLQQDPAYAWGALQTIVVEDIGMGNQSLCAMLSLATLKNWRKRVVSDDVHFFHGLIEVALNSQKNRTPCELSVLASAIDFTLGDSDPSDEYLLSRMFPPQGSIQGPTARMEMYQAATFLRARSRHGNDELLHKVLNRIHDYYEDPTDAAVAMLTWERPCDPMNNGIHALLPSRGLVHELKDDERATFTACEPHRGIPLSALDQHTELGRRVFKRLAPYVCKAIKTDRTFLVEQTIGALVFFEEGALVTKHVMTTEEDQIRTKQQDAYLARKHKGLIDLSAVREALSELWETHLERFRMEVLLNEVVKSA